MYMNCTVYTNYATLMTKYTCAWLHHPLKLLTSVMLCLVPIQVNQNGFMLWLICMFLGYDMPNQLVLNHQAHNYDDRLVDHFHYVHYNNMNYIVTHYLWLSLRKPSLTAHLIFREIPFWNIEAAAVLLCCDLVTLDVLYN